MKNQILQTVSRFLNGHLDKKRPVLLALSGGPDSMALFYTLLECQKTIPFYFGVAHVDHGWRKESTQEAKHLKKLAEKHQIPFHLDVLKIDCHQGNLEAKCREKRLHFFSSLCKIHNYQAVLLGHHQNDQAETVLKKVLEGGSVLQLQGMHPVITHHSLTLWRPFLHLPKKTLVEWLKGHGYEFFLDQTNDDPRFLRGRMRTKLMPDLEKNFGKNVVSGLSRLSDETEELHFYLQKSMEPLLNQVIKTPMGSFFDSTPMDVLAPFEAKCLIKNACQQNGICPSREILQIASFHLINQSPNRRFAMGNDLIIIDRGRLFITTQKNLQLPKDTVPLSDSLCYGNWEVRTRALTEHSERLSNWNSVWKGDFEVTVPLSNNGKLFLGPAKLNAPYPRSSQIRKWWNTHKTPAFLREAVPVFWTGNKIVHELLTGKRGGKLENSSRWKLVQFIKIS